jgi:hypothetical protein
MTQSKVIATAYVRNSRMSSPLPRASQRKDACTGIVLHEHRFEGIALESQTHFRIQGSLPQKSIQGSEFGSRKSSMQRSSALGESELQTFAQWVILLLARGA